MIIADTGFWVALLDRQDAYHQTVRGFAQQLNEPLISTLPVVTEVCYLLQKRCGSALASEFLVAQGEGLFSIFTIEQQHLARCALLMNQYANLPMDFADASLVVLAEHLGHGKIVSTDRRDFGAYRWKNRHPFDNLLQDI